jgi:PRTRC genetic system protein B
MNQNNLKEASFFPSQLIVVYNNGEEYYMEAATIGKQNKPGPFEPMKVEAFTEIAAALSKKHIVEFNSQEALPENILYNCQVPGRMNIIWYLLRPTRKIIFAKGITNKAKKITLKNETMKLPSIIFQYKNNGLSIYCFKENKRPDSTTKLFMAPFMNTSTEGSICLGNAQINRDTRSLSTFIRGCEHAFFDSQFTHTSGNVTKRDYITVIQEAIKKKEFPLKDLIQTHKTLNTLLSNR